MSVSITIFNANPLGCQITVNNGTQFAVAGASAPNWTPQVPTAGGPTWNNVAPAQNVMGPGDNYLIITPTGVPKPYNTTISLPGNIQWISLQLYIFFNSYTDVSWIVLNQGQFITGNLKLSSSEVHAAHAAHAKV